MQTIIRNLVMVIGLMALTACSYTSFSEVDALNEAEAVGSPFTQRLTNEYRMYSNSELTEMFDYPDALHFARKGLASAAGENVLPEPISDWNLSPRHIDELSTARGRLMNAMDLGARDLMPEVAAVAQARFDCWIEQQEESWQDDIQQCKAEFMDAMNQLEGQLGAMQPPAPVMDLGVDPNAPMLAEDAMYLVFFDWDESTIGQGGESVLDAVVQEVNQHSDMVNMINIIGHADTSGPQEYNRKLAMRRANAVRDALVQRGVDPAMLRVESRGENDLLVETADNVREPANRRANISFQ